MSDDNHIFSIYGNWKTSCRSALVYGHRWSCDFECRIVLFVQGNGSIIL